MYFSYLVVLFCHFIWFYPTCLNLINGDWDGEINRYTAAWTAHTSACTGLRFRQSRADNLSSRWSPLHSRCLFEWCGGAQRHKTSACCVCFTSQLLAIQNYTVQREKLLLKFYSATLWKSAMLWQFCLSHLWVVMLKPLSQTGLEAKILASASALDSSFWSWHRPRPRGTLDLPYGFGRRLDIQCHVCNYGTRLLWRQRTPNEHSFTASSPFTVTYLLMYVFKRK